MLNDLHAYASLDPQYVTVQGIQNEVTVKIVIDSLAIDDLPGVGMKPTEAQRLEFVRFNLSAIRRIAEEKLERCEAEAETRGHAPGLLLRIRDIDFAEYLSAGNRLSLGAFSPGAEVIWRRPMSASPEISA